MPEMLTPDVESRTIYKPTKEELAEKPPVSDRCHKWLNKCLSRPRARFAIELSKIMDEEEFAANRAKFAPKRRVRRRRCR